RLGREELDRLPDGLEGAEDVDRARRLEHRRRHRRADAARVRLPLRRRRAGRDRPELGRRRPEPDAAGRPAGAAADDHHAHGRPARHERDDDRRDDHPVSERIRVALLAGGRSSEHDISLASARSVLEALDPARYDVVSVAIGRDGRWELETGEAGAVPRLAGPGPAVPAETLPVPAAAGTMQALGSVDVVLPILHGPFGEDGTVQGLLELAD